MTNQSRSEWISVEDRLPEEGEWVLLHYGDWVYYGMLWWKDRGSPLVWKVIYAEGGLDTAKGKVTHWMPLPAPPEASDDTQS